MATSPDSKTIDRESSKMSLADRYRAKQTAGGTFDAYNATTNTLTQATTAPYGFAQKDVQYTDQNGFKTNVTTGTENFNDSALNYSDTINGGVKTDGVDKISTNWNGQSSLQDAKYTNDSGFKLKAPVGVTQFKDATGGTSKQLSTYMQGFNNTKYTSGTFGR